MPERNKQFFWGMAILALALVISAFVGAWSIRTFKQSGDTITVTGSARKPIRSDYIIWRGSVSNQQASLEEAYKEMKRCTDRLQDYFKEHRIPDNAVTFSSMETSSIPETLSDGRQTGKITAYRLTQNFEIRSEQVGRISAFAFQASELIREGIPLTSYPPEYLYTKLGELRVEMLAEAAKDARQRAEKIAESLGCRVGVVRSARMGVFQITPRHSTEISDYGINDTSSLEKDITAVVSVAFRVE